MWIHNVLEPLLLFLKNRFRSAEATKGSKLGVTVSAISAVEVAKGKAKPTLLLLRAIFVHFVAVSWFNAHGLRGLKEALGSWVQRHAGRDHFGLNTSVDPSLACLPLSHSLYHAHSLYHTPITLLSSQLEAYTV